MPVFAAAGFISARSVSSCFFTKAAGTGMTPVTLVEFWAVREETTERPYTPKARNTFRSCWIPAPPEGSEPAIVRHVVIIWIINAHIKIHKGLFCGRYCYAWINSLNRE